MGDLAIFLAVLGTFIAIASFALANSKNNRLKYGLGLVFIVILLAGIYSYLTPFSLPSLPYLSSSAPPVTPVVSIIPDRFDDFSSPGSGWDIIKNDPTGTADYSSDGTYQLDVNGGKFYSSLWQGLGIIGAGDFALQVKALGPWGNPGDSEQGIVIGWNKDTAIPTYAFTLNSSGECNFRKRRPGLFGLDQGRGAWLVEANEKIANLDISMAAHDLSLVKQGNILNGYVDGQFCTQYEMADYSGGYVGVAMLGPGRSSFDDFGISSVP